MIWLSNPPFPSPCPVPQVNLTRPHAAPGTYNPINHCWTAPPANAKYAEPSAECMRKHGMSGTHVRKVEQPPRQGERVCVCLCVLYAACTHTLLFMLLPVLVKGDARLCECVWPRAQGDAATQAV